MVGSGEFRLVFRAGDGNSEEVSELRVGDWLETESKILFENRFKNILSLYSCI